MVYQSLFLKSICLFLVLVFGINVANAQFINVKDLMLKFRIKNLGIGVEGKFLKSSAKVYFDQFHLDKSYFSGYAEVESIRTGISLRDEHITEKESFFNATKFPQLILKSVSIKTKTLGEYDLIWELTMRGITKRFTSIVKVISQQNNLVLSSEFTLNRNDWGLGGKSMTMSDRVSINIQCLVSK